MCFAATAWAWRYICWAKFGNGHSRELRGHCKSPRRFSRRGLLVQTGLLVAHAEETEEAVEPEQAVERRHGFLSGFVAQ